MPCGGKAIDDNRVEVRFLDVVNVARGDAPDIVMTSGRAVACGDWYVHVCMGPDACGRDPDHNFDVGHHPTGMRLGGYATGLTFWDARRIALALDDSGVDPCPDPSEMDPDLAYIAEAICASALMDHYVFPLENYLNSRDRAG